MCRRVACARLWLLSPGLSLGIKYPSRVPVFPVNTVLVDSRIQAVPDRFDDWDDEMVTRCGLHNSFLKTYISDNPNRN